MSRPSPSPGRLLQLCLQKSCCNRQKRMLRHRRESPLLSMLFIYAFFLCHTCYSLAFVKISLVEAAAGHLCQAAVLSA